MKEQLKIRLVEAKDLDSIESIFSDWLTAEETDHYLESVKQSINKSADSIKFNSNFFVAEFGGVVIGVAGYRNPIPKLVRFVSSDRPVELSMLYVASDHRGGKGVGTALLNMIMEQTKKESYQELVIRSSIKFEDSGWGFYDKFPGLKRAGQLTPPESEAVSQIWTMKY